MIRALFLFVSSCVLCSAPLHAVASDVESYGTVDSAEKALVEAVRQIGARSAQGDRDELASRLALGYAQRLAAQGYLDGHAGFSQRAAQLGGAASEVIAQVWARGDSDADPAQRCAQAWLYSPPHYSIMMPFHRRYGYAMAEGQNGQRFCVGLFAD